MRNNVITDKELELVKYLIDYYFGEGGDSQYKEIERLQESLSSLYPKNIEMYVEDEEPDSKGV